MSKQIKKPVEVDGWLAQFCSCSDYFSILKMEMYVPPKRKLIFNGVHGFETPPPKKKPVPCKSLLFIAPLH
jgi:hypothetical protein